MKGVKGIRYQVLAVLAFYTGKRDSLPLDDGDSIVRVGCVNSAAEARERCRALAAKVAGGRVMRYGKAVRKCPAISAYESICARAAWVAITDRNGVIAYTWTE